MLQTVQVVNYNLFTKLQSDGQNQHQLQPAAEGVVMSSGELQGVYGLSSVEVAAAAKTERVFLLTVGALALLELVLGFWVFAF